MQVNNSQKLKSGQSNYAKSFAPKLKEKDVWFIAQTYVNVDIQLY